MTTRELTNRLPEQVRNKVEEFRTQYTRLQGYDTRVMAMRDDTRARMAGYVLGLRDAGLITERDRQMIFVYMTTPKIEKEAV